MNENNKYRSIFLSDLHLGTELCQYEKLLNFLKSLESEDGHSYNLENLFLVGDIIDMTNFNNNIFWRKGKGQTVIKKFLRMADKKVNIFYLPGNHDKFLKAEIENHHSDNKDALINKFQEVQFYNEYVHTTANGSRYLIHHGDKYDGIVKIHPAIYKIGDISYIILVKINKIQNLIRKVIKMKEWSFSLWLKTKAKGAIKFVNNFEKLIVEDSKKYNVDGVITGHIHKTEDKIIDGVRYLNSGCWTEFCSFIYENQDGELKVVNL